MLECTTTKC